jgi:hypothetical protein
MVVIELKSRVSGVIGINGEVEMYRRSFACDDGGEMSAIADYCTSVGLSFCGDGVENLNYYSHRVEYRVSRRMSSVALDSMDGIFGDWVLLLEAEGA